MTSMDKTNTHRKHESKERNVESTRYTQSFRLFDKESPPPQLDECYICGSSSRNHPDYGELKTRPVANEAGTPQEFHDQCWVEWQALYEKREPWLHRTIGLVR